MVCSLDGSVYMADVLLEARNISKSFGAIKAAQDINLDLKQGEIHALIGPNGAGKSTLIQQLAGGLKPDSGSIHLGGEDVTSQATVKRARKGLARTFQVSALAMEDSVMQNVLLGAIGASRKSFKLFGAAVSQAQLRQIACEALERVGLLDIALSRTSELSHGQRRQLEIAIALTLKPKVFVMDEPMAGLGTEGSQQLTRFLGDLRQQAPILLVEHDMDAVFALADRISVLVYGKILATGTVDQIRSNEAVREAYLGNGV